MEKLMRDLMNFLSEWVGKNVVAPLLRNSFGDSQLESVRKFLLLSEVNEITGDGLQTYFIDMINKCIEVLTPVGYALVTTFFLIMIIQEATMDNITIERFIKNVIKLVISCTIIGNIGKIINLILNIGDALILKIADGQTSVSIKDSQWDEIGTSFCQSQGFISAILISFILWLLHQVVIIAVDISAFSRLIDIGWRAALMPVGIANLFEQGTSSPGFRFLKGFAAAVLSGFVMYVVVAIGFSISASMLGGRLDSWQVSFGIAVDNIATGSNESSTPAPGALTALLEVLAMQFATIGAAMSATNKTKELLGA